MKIEFNRTNEKLIILATTKADRSKLEKIILDLGNQLMVFQVVRTDSGLTLKIPLTSGAFLNCLARFAATHS
jgi:hypothetical protein